MHVLQLRFKQRSAESNQQGLILLAVLLVTSAFFLIGLSMLSYTTSQFQLTNTDAYNDNAQSLAEAGVDESIQQLNQNSNFTGYTAPQTFFNNTTQGNGTFTTVVAGVPGNTSAKTITSTGTIYRSASTIKPTSKRTIVVTVVANTSSGYSIETGPGGLILGGAASINNANVSVDGNLTLTGVARIGTGILPTTLNVAHQACPIGANPGATYPAVCSTGQPISLAYSTYIFGTVCATGQTSTGPNNNIQGGLTGQGLEPNCTAPPSSPPTYNRAAQIAAVTTTGAGNSSNYGCSTFPFLSSWTPNLKLTGDVNIGSTCILDVTGNVYITGNLNINGAAKVLTDQSVGTTMPVVIVDGKITVNGAATLTPNLYGTGIEFISFNSTASCSPGCTSLSGNDLATSAAIDTVNIGGAAIAPNMVFDSYWGQITLGGAGSIGAAEGQTVNMSGAGNVTFGNGLLGGGTTSWTISSYQQKYGP